MTATTRTEHLPTHVGPLQQWLGRRTFRPVRTPTLLQMEALDCGPAVLAIVLGYFGRWVPIEELRQAAGVSRNGSNAFHLLEVAREQGLDVQGMKAEPESLRHLQPPLIVHWRFSHFVVLEGFTRHRVRINDPRTGPREISLEELDEGMTGVVLALRPGASFERRREPRVLLGAIRDRLRGSFPALGFLVLVSLLVLVPGFVVPNLTRLFIDQILVASDAGWLPPLFAALAACAVWLGIVTHIQREHLLRLETRLAVVESSRFLWHLLRLPLDFFHKRYLGDISSRVALNDQIARLLSRELAVNALGFLVVSAFGFFMFQIDPILTLLSFAVISANLLIVAWVSKRRTENNRRLLREQGRLNGVALWGLETIESLKATGSESDLFARWAGHQARVVNLRQQLEANSLPLQTLPPLLAAFNTVSILGIGGLRVIEGELTLGALVAFQLLAAACIQPAQRLVGLGDQLQLAEGEVAMCADVLDTPPTIEITPRLGHEASSSESSQISDPRKLNGGLSLRAVTFGYGRLEAPLLDRFELELAPGQWAAIVGKTGSGKSTVARLVVGLYEPWSGEIRFDGHPRSAIERDRLSRSIAMVDQEIFVFEGSVRDNLTLWDPSIPHHVLTDACRDAEILDEIERRPGGFDSRVAEGGTNWSGGQLQRLEIARALACLPSLLVLDEATSALDPETERRVIANLRRRGITCLIVAHRLSTVRDADEILVLADGRVVERGSHAHLMAAGNAYNRLLVHE
ncbi:MAG: NHLP family bacteriocin export ABC transporter peptidase/permease/ATPase subunit [Acidobacteriota bacterium]